MDFLPTAIPDVILIKHKIYGDSRGFFMETYRANYFASAGITATFVQDNHSGSVKGTLRGLGYQIKQAQGKLVRVIAGEVYDVAVDLRRSSPTFGHWIAEILSAENKHQLWIPPGFAHGFYVLSEWAEVLFKTTDYYAPEHERTLLWNDQSINIKWPFTEVQPPVISSNDASGLPFDQIDTYA
jgi:dTDP-4-dehydrorhamnose 3,5-epimerase